ncbi:MAG: protein translocase subunit SecD [Acidimicrobiaceae bacterium]|nr:protein translocase subunit SecD [Acidimicrobiaceae bacterium]
MRRQTIFVVSIILLAVAGIIYTALAGNEPLLGLDLQGGASVVLEPEPNEDGTAPTAEVLDQAVEIIRNRVDGLGVREPEISRAGSSVLVQIPGVEDQQRALDIVGQTAELRFRPVLQDVGTEENSGFSSTLDMAAFPVCSAASTSSNEPAENAEPVETPEPVVDEEPVEGEEPVVDAEPVETPDPVVLPDPTPDAGADECMYAVDRVSSQTRYLLGPAPLLIDQLNNPSARLTGEVISTAAARLRTVEWAVSIGFKSGNPGIDDFNVLARECASASEVCPPTGFSQPRQSLVGRIAIEIDGVVESAPTVADPEFQGGVEITGGAMTERVAKDLALVLRFGALPVELTPQESRIVSSTLGEDALDAGIVAGIIGLSLVSLYLLFYYRLLGLVAISSLAISGALLWTMIAFLGESQGLALTLAGVTGLIVSIGVSVDSNVVYFEHLKEDVRSGRTVRSAVERAFPIAFSTIVKADVASLIAAVVLYFLTVGQVKGFALFLGLATVLDLIATYFFMGPVIRIMARRESMREHPKRYGIVAGDAANVQVSS